MKSRSADKKSSGATTGATKGLSLVFLSLMLALMTGSEWISGCSNKGLADGGGLELALMMGHAMVGRGGARGGPAPMEMTRVMMVRKGT